MMMALRGSFQPQGSPRALASWMVSFTPLLVTKAQSLSASISCASRLRSLRAYDCPPSPVPLTPRTTWDENEWRRRANAASGNVRGMKACVCVGRRLPEKKERRRGVKLSGKTCREKVVENVGVPARSFRIRAKGQQHKH